MPASPEFAEAISWDDGLLVGLPSIDREHEDLVGEVEALVAAADREVADRLATVSGRLEAHFASEEALIAEYEFGPGACHIEEHDRVRASLAEVSALVAAGDADVGRAFARALAEWLPQHIETMDSSLATWVTRRRRGGAPIVVRRKVGADRAGAGHPII